MPDLLLFAERPRRDHPIRGLDRARRVLVIGDHAHALAVEDIARTELVKLLDDLWEAQLVADDQVDARTNDLADVDRGATRSRCEHLLREGGRLHRVSNPSSRRCRPSDSA